MRAISVLSLEAGTSTLGCRAWIALRTRVSMSAMGSVCMILLLRLLPAGLDDSRNLAVEGKLAEAQTANAELAEIAARPAAAPAAVTVLAPQLGFLVLYGLLQPKVLCDFRCGRHCSSSSLLLPERHPHLPHQGQAFRVGPGRGRDGDIHALGLFDFGVIDFREDQLVLDPQGVIAAAVERFGGDAAEIPNAGQRHIDQPVEKFIHALAAKRDHAADRHVLAKLERGDRLACLGDYRLLAGDLAELVDRAIHQLGILGRLAEADVDRDLFELR